MGVKASYYEPLALAFQAGGTSAVTADLRGHGRSAIRAGRRTSNGFGDFGYREILDEDLPAFTAAVHERFPGRPIVLLGHSLGGQLACLWASTRPAGVAGQDLDLARRHRFVRQEQRVGAVTPGQVVHVVSKSLGRPLAETAVAVGMGAEATLAPVAAAAGQGGQQPDR